MYLAAKEKALTVKNVAHQRVILVRVDANGVNTVGEAKLAHKAEKMARGALSSGFCAYGNAMDGNVGRMCPGGDLVIDGIAVKTDANVSERAVILGDKVCAMLNNILANIKKKNIYTVSNGIATNCHPLSPSVRKSFDIVPFEFASEEGVKE